MQTTQTPMQDGQKSEYLALFEAAKIQATKKNSEIVSLFKQAKFIFGSVEEYVISKFKAFGKTLHALRYLRLATPSDEAGKPKSVAADKDPPPPEFCDFMRKYTSAASRTFSM